MTKYIYLFKENGNCCQMANFAFEDVDLDEYTRLNNANSYVLHEEHLDIRNLKLINNELKIIEEINIEKLTIETKTKRNLLILESDWTDTLSAKSRFGDDLYNAWQAYRQALRDLTKQEGYPQNVVWPTKPE